MILLKLISLFIVFSVSLASECKKRTFTGDSFVCVCDENYCDTLDIEKTIEPGTIIIYESDQKTSRLEKTIVTVDQVKSKIYNDNQFVMNVNVSDKKQQILGFGGTLTDGAAINILTLLKGELINRVMNDYFGPHGLEYNVARISVGGSDSSVRAYSLDDTELDFDLSHFALAEEDIKYKIPLLKLAKELNPEFRAFGSAWSSPAWMKTNHAINGNGGLIWGPGDVYYKLWADYYVKYLNAYLENGVKLWGLTTENEPAEGIGGSIFNALAMTPAQIRDWVKLDLGPALRAAGWGKENLTLMINDDNTNDIPTYVNTLLDDPEAASYVSGIAYHWYSRNYPSSYQILAQAHEKYPDYFLFSSEGGWTGVASDYLGSWTRAEAYALDILEGLQHYSSGWTDWTIAVDTSGGPNWAKNWVDSTVVINSTSQEYYKNPMYYVLAHFSKFLPIGSTRVSCSVVNVPNNVHTTSFITPDNKLVLILLNMNDDHVDMTINGFASKTITTTLKPRSIRNMVIAL